ncbi:hypothetical protein [Chryseobacterium sp. POE27]|uniref:hypothetical protein n=1 Tax=Chryseobacterium sp. POE27 TaxID=3138177 RepID=UPI00321983F4
MIKIKFITGLLTLFLLGNLNAQELEQSHETSVYIKGNALLIPIGIVNLGLEHQLTKKSYGTGRCSDITMEIICRT